MRLRMAQLLLRPVALFTHFFLTQNAANYHGKMTNVLHLDAVCGAFSNQPCNGFLLHSISQEDNGRTPAIPLKQLQCASFPLLRGRVFS